MAFRYSTGCATAASRNPRPYCLRLTYLNSAAKTYAALRWRSARAARLPKLVRKASWAVQLNEHIAERGDIVFRHACKLGFEGIVSKRKDSPYRSGRSPWLKMKNANAPAMKREAERIAAASGGGERGP
jgi:ATP-dependent DNA ligase